MYILGISCFYHDAAACLIKDGVVIAAAQEERFTRKKHDQEFPANAINYCLESAKINVDQLDYIGFYDKPFIKFERILLTYIATFPRSLVSFIKVMPMWLKEKLWVESIIRKKTGFKSKIIFIEHHLSHAASSYLMSGFKESNIITVDGVGEWATATLAIGKENEIKILKEIRFPHSLGLLYSAFTYYLGFKVNSAEYKVMGLAPYGKPVFYDLIMDKLIKVKDDGSFKINMKYFAYDYGLRMTNENFHRLFGMPPRRPESELTQKHKDIASSLQKVTEEVMLRMAKFLYDRTKIERLCLAGGVALNCVANGKIVKKMPVKEIFIQPAAGDAGAAMGVAVYIYYTLLGNKREGQRLENSFLGPEYSNSYIEKILQENRITYEKLNNETLIKKIAKLLVEQNVVGWFQGRMEFGPRALGNRSILGDPRNPDNRDKINLKIKFRESFRPFAPSVTEEGSQRFFELNLPSPYMLLVANVKEDMRIIPAVTHVDGSARVHTVNSNDNPLFYDLIKEFERLTGIAVVINTSFNIRGEPIVCCPEDAFRCFMNTYMDYLVMGNFLLDKKIIGQSTLKAAILSKKYSFPLD